MWHGHLTFYRLLTCLQQITVTDNRMSQHVACNCKEPDKKPSEAERLHHFPIMTSNGVRVKVAVLEFKSTGEDREPQSLVSNYKVQDTTYSRCISVMSSHVLPPDQERLLVAKT